jgi:glycosyltransferase involved in cell wall biosynthesis
MNAIPPLKSVTIAGTSPALAVDDVEVVVTLPTFRRPQQVLATLDSLARQKTTRRFAVIVMENDDEGNEGMHAALPLFESGAMRGLVIVAHERGNCSAYNAGWHTALLRFPNFSRLLVIDDDEIADPMWLETMCLAASASASTSSVGRRCQSFAEPGHQVWADTSGVRPALFASPVRSGALYSSGNLLVSRNVLLAMGPPHFSTCASTSWAAATRTS